MFPKGGTCEMAEESVEGRDSRLRGKWCVRAKACWMSYVVRRRFRTYKWASSGAAHASAMASLQLWKQPPCRLFPLPGIPPSSSWLAPSALIGHWIKLHLFWDACPDYPSVVDLSCYSCYLSCCLLQHTCHHTNCFVYFVVKRSPDCGLHKGRDPDFHVHLCVHSALCNTWPVGW